MIQSTFEVEKQIGKLNVKLQASASPDLYENIETGGGSLEYFLNVHNV